MFTVAGEERGYAPLAYCAYPRKLMGRLKDRLRTWLVRHRWRVFLCNGSGPAPSLCPRHGQTGCATVDVAVVGLPNASLVDRPPQEGGVGYECL